MARSLIVNADDLGISAGVTRGIIEAHHKGIVTSTSVIVNLPDSAESIRRAQREAPQLGLGLHFNLSFGKPVLASGATLMKTADSFCSTYNDLVDMIPGFDSEHVRAEIRAQFQRFTELAGCLPDHIDSHHGVGRLCASAGEAMVELVQEYGLPTRRYELDGVMRQPDHFEMGFYNDTATLETLTRILRTLPEGITEIGCHPGYGADLKETYNVERDNELRIITDPSIRAIITEENIRLINFSAL